MQMLDQWEQTATFNPTDPTQKKIEKYAGIPGAYASFYFNRVPVQGQLKGPFTTGIATGAGILIGVTLAGIGLGFAGGLIKKARGGKPLPGMSGLGGLRGWRRIFSRRYKSRKGRRR